MAELIGIVTDEDIAEISEEVEASEGRAMYEMKICSGWPMDWGDRAVLREKIREMNDRHSVREQMIMRKDELSRNPDAVDVPFLDGSPKQIRWAWDIRKRFLSRAPKNDREFAISIVQGVSRAKWWINRKDMAPAQIIAAVREHRAEINARKEAEAAAATA